MTPEEILHTTLTNDPTVAGLIGTSLFADAIEACAVRPAVVYQRSATDPQMTMHGVHFASFVTIAVVVHADIRADADEIARAVHLALEPVGFWPVAQSAGFEPEIEASSVLMSFTYFYIEH